MQHIMGGFGTIYAWLASYPFVTLLLFWLIFYMIHRERKKALQLSMDVTTLFLIGSVSVMVDSQVHSGLGGFWLIMLMLLIIAGLMGNAQNRARGEVDVKRLIRAVWRIGFLLLSLLYIIFVIIGMAQSIASV